MLGVVLVSWCPIPQGLLGLASVLLCVALDFDWDGLKLSSVLILRNVFLSVHAACWFTSWFNKTLKHVLKAKHMLKCFVKEAWFWAQL